MRWLAIHFGGVLVFTFLHAAITAAARVVILRYAWGRPASYWPQLRELFFLNFDWESMTYWAVIGLSHAVHFHREARNRALTSAQLETRLAEAQLQALQRQLHPHFLFNTLHTISALMHRDVEAADAMLARLSDLLRLTLDRIGNQQVSLREELDFVTKYVEIERARYGDRLRVEVDVDPDALDAAVPSFVLQPLVENAVRHGIAPQLKGGRIWIRAVRNSDRLRLVVGDDGHGVSSDKLLAFNTGVGLTNTRTRLQHLYGEGHTFDFKTPPGGGLEVTVIIPFSVDTEPAPAPMVETVA
jgi:LytS/YehU family sensor histidine kinase